MRWMNVISLVTATLWLGGSCALAFAAMVLFPQAKMGALEVNVMGLGEIFGLLFSAWTWVGFGCLAILLLSRMVAWFLRLRHRQTGLTMWLQVAACAVLLAFTLLSARSTWTAMAAYQQMDSAQTVEEEKTAYAAFNELHHQSTKHSQWATFVLLIVVGGLAISLGRSRKVSASAAASAA